MPRMYKQGQLLTLMIPFIVNKVATDPTTVTLTLTDPNGVATVPALTHTAGTGLYSCTVDLTSATLGPWRMKVVATGTVQAVFESSFIVTGTQS